MKDSRSPKLQDNTHTHTPQENCLQQMAWIWYSCKAQMAGNITRTERSEGTKSGCREQERTQEEIVSPMLLPEELQRRQGERN